MAGSSSEKCAAVDVVMPVRDGARHLSAALSSLQNQTLRDFRLLVVDDGSTDETPSILASKAAEDRRIEVLRRHRSGGVAAALNHGLAACTAPLVARADADDVYAPRRLEAQRARMAQAPHADVLSCGYVRIDEAGRERDAVTPLTGHDRLRFHCLFMNGFLHPGVMFRRGPVAAMGGYDENYWTAQDSELWDRLMAAGLRFDNLPEPLVRYRVHSGAVTKKRGAAGRALSLSVPQRALSRYLLRPVGLEETRCGVDLYQGFETLSREDVACGARLLGEVRDAAAGESAAIRTAFAARVLRGCFIQARRAGRDRPLSAMAAAAIGARWRLSPVIPGAMPAREGGAAA